MPFLSPNHQPPACHQGDFLEAVAVGRGTVAPGQFYRPSYTHFLLGQDCLALGRQSCPGEMLGCAATFRAGSWHGGCRVITRPFPLVAGPTGAPLWGRCCVVLTGAALWYLKRGYPLYVHFINGEYTGGDSYLRIKL